MSRAFLAAAVFATALLASSSAQAATRFHARVDDATTSVRLRAVDADGNASAYFGPFAVAPDGSVTGTLPASVVKGVRVNPDDGYRAVLRLETDSGADAGSVTVSDPPTTPVLSNEFVSSLGWVKPGDEYEFTLRVHNYSGSALDNATVALSAPPSTTILSPTSYTIDVPAGGEWRQVVKARADTLEQDPEIAWKNLSASATLNGGAPVLSHGPKVIPPGGGFETARYGDRPFPVVPVDYRDRKHAAASTASQLAYKINDPSNAGSTFNLYQEISYKQLFPHATIPSDGIATADWGSQQYAFTQPTTPCPGITTATTGTYTTSPRIQDGWYQLPGDTQYYGLDGKGSALIGAETGVGALQDIDSGCGPTGKAVYDAAQIADPEIDYDQFDTDKDGVVDFFMMVFPGLGGNGDSQLNGVPPYDNIWPHSSDLQNSYVDANGEKGYVTHDQSHDLEGHALYWTDASRSKKTTDKTDFPVYVRVGPYNVNPESAITYASVISHEYGHSLGLPDYYSTGSRTTYGGWTLMAEDHSQNIDAIGKKELGWLVPQVLEPGQHQVTGWEDTKKDIHRIDWKRPDGTPYSLTGEDVHNGQGYVAELPGRRIIDPAIVPSGTHLWWSGSGNGFDCPPSAGHNLDLALPAVPAGTKKLTLSFKSRWDTEWDFDYGFVLGSTDNGKTYSSYPSANGYTSTTNPNSNGCQATYSNGLTGSSGSWKAGTQTVDRAVGNYPEATFVDDSYDISNLIGKPGAVIRFAYATDPGLARPGWFIDDVQVKADDKVIYSSDFEQANDPALYNGGCGEGGLQTAQKCTHGWQYVAADQNSPAEHAYLLELRDRSGFDAHGYGESERSPLAWDPGVLLGYTDEDHGYGNVGTDDPPAQTPLDSRPEPGSDTPNLDDAAFKAGDTFSDTGHTDNYKDADGNNWVLNYGCLTFKVNRMAGNDVGPEVFGAYNLNADVAFTTTAQCGQFDYGTGYKSPGVPTGSAPTPPASERKPSAAAATAPPSPAAPQLTKAATKPPTACKARAVNVRSPLSSFRTTCPSFGPKALKVTFRLKQAARVRVDLLRGKKVIKHVLKPRTRQAKHTYTLKVSGKGLKAGDYTLRLRATRAHKTVTLKLPVHALH